MSEKPDAKAVYSTSHVQAPNDILLSVSETYARGNVHQQQHVPEKDTEMAIFTGALLRTCAVRQMHLFKSSLRDTLVEHITKKPVQSLQTGLKTALLITESQSTARRDLWSHLSERVGDTGVERERRVLARQDAQPALRNPRRDEVALVEQQQQVLVRGVLLQVVLQELAPRAHRIARVDHLNKRFGSLMNFLSGVVRLYVLASDLLHRIPLQVLLADTCIARAFKLRGSVPCRPKLGSQIVDKAFDARLNSDNQPVPIVDHQSKEVGTRSGLQHTLCVSLTCHSLWKCS